MPVGPSGSGRRERLALLVLQLGALVIILVALPDKAFDLDRFFVPKELTLIVAATLAAALCLAGARVLALTRVDVFLAGFLALSTVSALFAPNYWLAARALAVSVAGLAVFWTSRALAAHGRARALLVVLGLGVVVGAATALAQAYGWESEYVSINRKPGGTFGNRNFMAHLTAIGLPVLLALTLLARRSAGVLLGLLAIAMLAAALVLSRTRAAWLALLVIGAVLLALVLAKRRALGGTPVASRAALAAVAALGGVAVAIALPNTLEWRSESPYLETMTRVANYQEGSGRGRVLQYTNSWRMAAEHPVLGVGPGNWPVRYPRYASRDDPSLSDTDHMTANPWPSSDWVAFVAERGLVATALLALAFVGLGLSAIWRAFGARRADELLPALALLGALGATVIVGVFDAALLLPIPAFYAWALVGALAPPARARLTIALPDRRRRWLLISVLVIGTLASTRAALQVAAMETFDDGDRLADMERAVLLDPGSYRLRIRLAEAYARRGRCAGVRIQATAARALFPEAPQPKQLLKECGRRK